MWTQGFTQIILIQHFRTDKHNSKLQQILHLTGTTPENYHFSNLTQSNAVYLKCPAIAPSTKTPICPHPDIPPWHTYFGSTITDMLHREANRVSKLRQLLQSMPTKCELAIRWWHYHLNYHWFSTIVLTIQPSRIKTRALEHMLIARFNSTLNYPFIGKYVIQKATGFKNNVSIKRHHYHINYIRWMTKARSRHHHNLPLCTTTQYWEILFGLASNTREQWDTQRSLRTSKFTKDEIYLLWRMHHNIEEPHQSIISGQLKSVFQFKQIHPPPKNLPIRLPPLHHTDFSKAVGKILRQHVLRNKSILPPFHIPTCNVQDATHPKILDLIYNHKSWDFKFSFGKPSSCPCRTIRTQQPQLHTIKGHIVAPMSHFQLPQWAKSMAAARSNSKYYISKQRYLNFSTKQMQKWCKHHNLPDQPITDQWKDMIHEQWNKHHPATLQHPRPFVHSTARFLKNEFRKFVVHGEDHKPFKTMVYCPIHYYNATQTTWQDPTTFQPYPLSPTQFHQTAPTFIPSHIRKHYSWGIKDNADVPTGMVLLKASKGYLKGRTVLNYSNNIIAKLLTATTIALNHIISVLFPNVPGTTPMPVIFKNLHQFLASMSTHDPHDASTHYTPLNDDLVGFFNSIPQEDILRFTSKLIHMYADKQQRPINSIILQVDLYKPKSNLHKCIGSPITFHHAAKHNIQHHKNIHLKHILDIINLSLTLGVVAVQGKCYKQILGSTIGNQISPTICSIPILFREAEWKFKYDQWYNSHQRDLWYERYVDNRFAILPSSIINDPALQEFTDQWFYRAPIQLETVPDTHFLGTNVNVQDRTVSPILPTESWQIQPSASADTNSRLLASFQTRLHLITTCTFPKSACTKFSLQLIQLYENQGYNRNSLLRLTFKHFAKKQMQFNPSSRNP